MLASIYGNFAEGFDTADLADARTLLAACRGSSCSSFRNP